MSKKWFIIEGNIGSGKSTLLKMLQDLPNTETIQEPVDIWLSIKDNNNVNLLQTFYNDMERYSYMFQTMVFTTRVKVLNEPQIENTRISERSIWTDRYVFGRACIEDDKMNSIEKECYQEWFSWLETQFRPQPDGIIYVKCSPEKCLERINKRHRHEEDTIPLNYLSKLHNYHTDWFSNWTQTPLLVLDNEQDNNWNNLVNQVKTFIN
jgi:deoxyadenosine/deoxycytidine kinase